MIAEFNPFHLGHKQIVQKAKEKTNCDYMFCFMGQNFTQRGEPAIINKQTRAKMAINGGFDAVFEVPNALTMVNAEMFAKFMLKAIQSFPHITHLCFGSECGQIEPIVELANFLNSEPFTYKKLIKTFLKEGFSLSASKQKALEYVIDQKFYHFKKPSVTKTLLSLPNNILAVEYTKVLLKENLPIIPITFKRLDYSATEIRKLCHIGNFKQTLPLIGESGYNIMVKAQTTQGFPNLKLLNYVKLMSARLCNFDVSNVLDVSEGLDRKIVNESQKHISYEGFLNAISGKRYGKNRIERILLSNILEIDKAVIHKALRRKNLPYLKAVCIRRSRKLMPEIIKSSTRIILRKKDANFVLQKSKLARELNEIDNKCEKLYSLITNKQTNKNNLFIKTEFIK